MALDRVTDASQKNNTEGGAENTDQKNESSKGEEESAFECNICLDTAKDAVISMCGHLFW